MSRLSARQIKAVHESARAALVSNDPWFFASVGDCAYCYNDKVQVLEDPFNKELICQPCWLILLDCEDRKLA